MPGVFAADNKPAGFHARHLGRFVRKNPCNPVRLGHISYIDAYIERTHLARIPGITIENWAEER